MKCGGNFEETRDFGRNGCNPTLFAGFRPSKSFLMGSSERIHVDVEVHNNGEDSYESMM